MAFELMEWISPKEFLPPKSFIESDDENVTWEAYNILVMFYHGREVHITTAIYEEEDLSPFPSIPQWRTYFVGDGDSYFVNIPEPKYWMPLPYDPDLNEQPDYM